MAVSNLRTVAIIVTYHPDLARVHEMLAALLPQVHAAVIVDNGSKTDVAAWAKDIVVDTPVHVIALGKNTGIAAAQNAGIDWAKSQGADTVLLLDQDSRPAPDMVEKLSAAYENLRDDGRRIAAVGPQIFDANRGEAMLFYKTTGLTRKTLRCTPESEPFSVDSVIASGCLIPLDVLADIGGLRADFFIDYVDIEWCLRAQRQGYQVFAVGAAVLFHSLGDRTQKFMDRKLTVHRPLRYYYGVRNAIYMYLYLNIAPAWKVLDAIKLCRRYVFFSLFTAPRFANWLHMTRGIWDGLWGRLGPMPGSQSPLEVSRTIP